MTDPDLVERLVAHRTLGRAPREQLEWLASRGTLRTLSTGEAFTGSSAGASRPAGTAVSEPIDSLYVVLSGRAVIRVDRGGGPRRVLEWNAGDVAGLLPYSRLTVAPGVATVEEPTEILAVHRDHFPEMMARCQELTAIMVHVMLDRARRFTTSDSHDEKILSLGRLAAGLAHELNNPASALARSAQELSGRVFEVEAAALALGAVGLSAEQLAVIGGLRAECLAPGSREALSPLERADREEAVAAWLARRGLRGDLAEALSECALPVQSLDRLAASLDPDALEFALRSLGAGFRTRRLASEVETAAERIHSLVAAIKGFSYMDQSAVAKPVAIGKGLADTIAVLGSKARQKSVTVTLEVAPDLPLVEGFGGELNQVWANLIDNAIDASPESGRVEVIAAGRGDHVVVRVVDEGPGIPAAELDRIFDPFYTTKPPGQGTGLGLDIARRLVRQHEGQIEAESRPGRTEFRVILPRV